MLEKCKEKISEVEKYIIIEKSNISRVNDEIKSLQENSNKLEGEKSDLGSYLNETLEKTNFVNNEILSIDNKHNENKKQIEELGKELRNNSDLYEEYKSCLLYTSPSPRDA